eukprot:6182970-Pleurochrysis_carterae.AAC.1
MGYGGSQIPFGIFIEEFVKLGKHIVYRHSLRCATLRRTRSRPRELFKREVNMEMKKHYRIIKTMYNITEYVHTRSRWRPALHLLEGYLWHRPGSGAVPASALWRGYGPHMDLHTN